MADGAEQSIPAVSLARKLRTVEYFTLAFGSMVGVCLQLRE
jgi:hypothetical protein